MRLRNMLKICLAFLKCEPQYAYKCYACKKTCTSHAFPNSDYHIAPLIFALNFYIDRNTLQRKKSPKDRADVCDSFKIFKM